MESERAGPRNGNGYPHSAIDALSLIGTVDAETKTLKSLTLEGVNLLPWLEGLEWVGDGPSIHGLTAVRLTVHVAFLLHQTGEKGDA